MEDFAGDIMTRSWQPLGTYFIRGPLNVLGPTDGRATSAPTLCRILLNVCKTTLKFLPRYIWAKTRVADLGGDDPDLTFKGKNGFACQGQTVHKLKNCNLLTCLPTEWFIELHFAAKNPDQTKFRPPCFSSI